MLNVERFLMKRSCGQGCCNVMMVRDVIGRIRNDRSGCPGSVLLEQVRREEQLAHGNALIRVATWKQTGIRGHHRKRRVIRSDEGFPVFPPRRKPRRPASASR